MPRTKTAKEPKKAAKEQKAEPKGSKGGSYLVPAVIIIVVIAIAAVLGYIVSTRTGGGGNQQGLAGFESSFYSAPRIAIYATYQNGTAFSYEIGCTSRLIQQLESQGIHHRSNSTMDFMVIANSTSCLLTVNLGSPDYSIKNLTTAQCLAISANEPSIFINYSEVNSTVIKGTSLYTSGDDMFLNECGIASELG